MLKLFFENKGYLTVNGQPTRSIECGANEDVYVLACDDFRFVPTALKLEVRGGKLRDNCGIRAVYWGGECASVLVKMRKYTRAFPPLPLLFTQANCMGVTHMATFYSAPAPYFTLETQGETYTDVLPLSNVNALDIFAHAGSGSALLILRFCGEKQFVYCLKYDKDYSPVCKCLTDGAAVNGDRIILTDILRDSCRLSVTREYSLAGVPELISRCFTYRENIPSYPPIVLPRVYCESAMCGDREMCGRISHADAFSAISGCRGFCTPPHMRLSAEKTALLRPCDEGFRAEIYSFEVNSVIERVTREL